MSTAHQETLQESAILRRATPCRELRLAARCEWGSQEPVAAELVDISLSGALLDSAALQVLPSIRPRRGSILKVQVQLPGSLESIDLVGSVMRHTGTGVAIQSLRLPKELRKLLEFGWTSELVSSGGG